jgi:hypothetical protein
VALVHDSAANAKTYATKSDTKREDDGIRHPDARPEKFEGKKIDKVGARRSELEEVAIRKFAVQHSLAVHPEVNLIAAQKDGDVRTNKQIQVQVDRDGEAEKRLLPSSSP